MDPPLYLPRKTCVTPVLPTPDPTATTGSVSEEGGFTAAVAGQTHKQAATGLPEAKAPRPGHAQFAPPLCPLPRRGTAFGPKQVLCPSAASRTRRCSSVTPCKAR